MPLSKPSLQRVALSAALLLLATPLGAQQLTVEKIYGSNEFRTVTADVEFFSDGENALVLEATDSGTNVWLEGIRTGERTRLIEGRRLIAPNGTAPLVVENITFSEDRRHALVFADAERVWRLNTKGIYYTYDIGSGTLRPVSTATGMQMFAAFSPDARRVGFVRDNNIFVADPVAGTERQLTFDGSEEIINGTSDWVYEEELGVRSAWRWSPDGRHIAYWRFDQSAIRPFFMIDELDTYSKPIALRYPKAGTANSQVEIRVVDVATGETRTIPVEAGDGYFARMDWAASDDEIVIQRLNRHQNRLDVILANVRTGEQRTILSETDEAWVDVDDDLRWTNGGRNFIWSSERDGYNHIYLFDRNGTLVRQVTQGEWEVTEVLGVDDRRGAVYFTAAQPTPMERHLFRARLDNGSIEQLTREPGVHDIEMSPSFSHFVDTFSQIDTPPTTRLHALRGDFSRTLAENGNVAQKIERMDLRKPEFFQMQTSDGVTLNGWMIKPPNFNESQRYPVLLYTYGGPGSQTVLDSWGGPRYLWHQLLAERGFIVASVDNRGTGARGRDFKKVTYLNLGEYETRDQAEAARWFAAQPYVDGSRIGIWGWSYGGYMTALGMMNSDVFRVGVSVAPVADWRLYDTIYTERFMRTPQENPEGYLRSAPVARAADLQGKLLLIHGTGDDNVHFQNSVQLTNALQEAGKQFDFMLYANRTHSIAGGNTQVHLFTKITDWLETNLKGALRPAS